MPIVHVTEKTPLPPERVLDAARDFSERRVGLKSFRKPMLYPLSYEGG